MQPKVTLHGVSETLLITLNVRARETLRKDSLFKDEKAVAMAQKLDYDFSHLIMHRHDEVCVILRMRQFDRQVRAFLERNPASVVVHLGCGLDTRFERVDNGRVEWFDLDLPDVIRLRQELLPETNSRQHLLAASAFDEGWLEEVNRFKPRAFLFISEGVLPYFEEELVKSLFLRLRGCFPGCELVCDAHTPFVIWADNIHLQLTKVEARLHWSIRNGRDVESWAEGIQLLDEWNYYVEDKDSLGALRWMRLIPGLAKSSGVFHYRLGEACK